MSYKKSCFIRKNTEELRNKLIKLGYDYGGKSGYGNHDCLYSSKDVGRFFECSQKPARYDMIIDCEDNEELFLALAALRDDINDYQWFIWQDEGDEGDKWKQYIPGEKWQEWWWFEVKKATPEEIIEHFKNKIMKKRLAIKGHRTRGKEVIEILQMLGGQKTIYGGTDALWIYYLNNTRNIMGEFYEDKSLTHLSFEVLTLEEFLEKFPFKINDRVINSDYSGTGIITEMAWDCNNRGVKYCVKFEDFGTIAWFNRHEINFIENELFREDNIDPLHELCENLCNNKLSTLMIDSEVCDDEVEIILNDYEIEIRDGKTYAIKKKSKYPKTFIEVLNFWHPDRQIEDDYQRYHKKDLIENFQRLLYARDAYWKIAGEEMGLDKPWKQDYNDRCFIIVNNNGNIHHYEYHGNNNVILAFPTAEMRDAFYENFETLINECKELL